MPLQDPFFVGDLTKQSIMDVWNSAAVLDFIYPMRERFAGTACYKCQEFDACVHELGQCFRDAYFAYDTLFSPPPDCPKAPATTRRVQ
jgi:MoaA/NifB/PqqE/SkfB family radical SAM enzyme